jgi:DNA-binding response OmpR family regulator
MSKDGNMARRKAPYDLRKFRLLILEDSAFIGKLLASALKNMGVGLVVTAQTIAEAKECIMKYNGDEDQVDFDVVMTDWLLPDGMGADFVQWIRDHKRDNIKYLPTIVCSAYTSTDLVEQCRECGATEVMVKPVSAEKIAHRILYVIDKPRPFIQLQDFFGPDRRRREQDYAGDNRRLMSMEDYEIEYEQAG